MPYSVNEDWYHLPTNRLETLQQLALRASLKGIIIEKIEKENLKKLPKSVKLYFQEVKKYTFTPSIMRLHSINNANRKKIILYFDPESIESVNSYAYYNDHFGFKTYNIILNEHISPRSEFEDDASRDGLIQSLRESYRPDIASGVFEALNIVEYKGPPVPGAQRPARDNSAASFAQALSSALKIPVSYHTGQPDVIPLMDAVNSTISELRDGNKHSAAGMRTIRSKEHIDPNVQGDFTSRSYLAGWEYSLALSDFLE